MSVKYIALQNLPFGIKKDDILTIDNYQCKNYKSEIIPLDPSKETLFFKKIKKPKYKSGDFVYIKCPINNKKAVGINKGYEIIRYRSDNSYYVIIQTPQGLVEIKESLLYPCNIYWFINSSGKICFTIFGKEPNVDIFRKLSFNYFVSKEEAICTLNNILSLNLM